jgi:threonine efflux protein
LAFERMPVMRELLRWLAAAYLLWLAYRMLMEIWSSGALRETDVNGSTRRPFLRGLFCNLLNPKAALFLAAVCAPFLRGGRPEWWPFAIWGIVVGEAAVLWSLWACLLQWNPLRSRYERAAHWIDGAFAVVLAALAIRLIIG